MFFYTCIFAASMVLVLFLARPIFWFISFLGYYWYIFFPGFIIFSFAFQRFNKTRSYRKYYNNLNNEENQNFYFNNTNRTPIENGKLTKPVKNATLIGTNVQILNEVSMIGNDMGYFLGTCGKEGQSAPVTAGTPTLKITKMTVGGQL